MKADEVKVGAVTLGGIVILALMLTFLGVFSFAGRTYKLNVMFDDVNGLKVGNEVRFAGVPVGKVDDIVVDGSKVKVVMKMDEKQKIPRNSQFAIGMDGVMGTKFVTIAPPKIATGLVFKAGETITGQQAGGIDKLMDSSGKVLDKLEVVVDAFSNVFGDKNVQKSMREGFVQTGEVAKNMNAFTKALATMAQQNQGDIQHHGQGGCGRGHRPERGGHGGQYGGRQQKTPEYRSSPPGCGHRSPDPAGSEGDHTSCQIHFREGGQDPGGGHRCPGPGGCAVQ